MLNTIKLLLILSLIENLQPSFNRFTKINCNCNQQQKQTRKKSREQNVAQS